MPKGKVMSADAGKAGRIYVLTNNDMPSLVKVGKTRGDAVARAVKLSTATGIPSRFDVHKEYRVIDCDAAERRAHLVLERSVGRPNANREFFLGPPERVVQQLDSALVGFIETDAREIFNDALTHLRRKEFTMGCLVFEENISQAFHDSRILGGYLACCCAISREPLFSDHLLALGIKNEVIKNAIEFVREFDTEPENRVIEFVRSLT
jgi:T5orf172 domain